MAKQQEPTRATVMEISRRLSAAYEADDLSGMEPDELTAAVRELHVLARRAGFELDDQLHPVQTFLETVADWDEDHAYELLDAVREQELHDRAQLAAAEAEAGRQRFQAATGEILARSGVGEDEFRAQAFRNLASSLPASDNMAENVEVVREAARAVAATGRTIDRADLRTEILSALPASQSPFGEIHQARRREAIQEHAVATANWDGDLETEQPTLTHDEAMEAQAIGRGEIVAASQGPRALREYREQNNLDTSEYA